MTGETGTVYLLHYDRPIGDLSNPLGQAQHYTGWARHLEARLAHHRAGSGASITAAFAAAGIGFEVARTWKGTRDRERSLKNQGGAARRCPLCRRSD